MCKVVALMNNNEESAIIAFNLAFLLQSKKTILLINFSEGVDNLSTKSLRRFNSKNLIAPFVLYSFTKKISLLCLSKNAGRYNVGELITHQIKQIRSQFDIILVDLPETWTKYAGNVLQQTDETIAIYRCDDFAFSNLYGTLAIIRDAQLNNGKLQLNYIILDKFDRNNTNHIDTMLQINKMLHDAFSFIVLEPIKELIAISDNPINYIENNLNSNYALSLNKLADALIIK